MTIRYVGPGGNDANDGLSYPARKLTFSGMESSPPTPGDLVWMAPGVYRGEMLIVGVSGMPGNPITYQADLTGAHTDGVGGLVRWTGSLDDKVRGAAGLNATEKDYRVWDGICFDSLTGYAMVIRACKHWIVRNSFFPTSCPVHVAIHVGDPWMEDIVFERCYFASGGWPYETAIWFHGYEEQSGAGIIVRNCIFRGGAFDGACISFSSVGGALIQNCHFYGATDANAVSSYPALTMGQVIEVYDCLFDGCGGGVYCAHAGDLVEDYNNFDRCRYPIGGAAISGGHSTTYPTLVDPRWFFEMVNGGRMVTPFDLSQWSQLINLAGTNPHATDMRGTAVIGAQREWGPLEYDTTLLIESAAGGGGKPRIAPNFGGIG